MLKNILLSNSAHVCTIIQDDNTVRGIDLFIAALRGDIGNDEVRKVYLISCENPPEYYLGSLKNSKVVHYGLFQDPTCWLEKNESQCDEILHMLLTFSEGSSSVMIDSLNFLFLLKSEDYVFNLLHKLRKQFKKITCLLHGDEITCSDTIKKLMFLSNVYIKLYAKNSILANDLMNDKKKKLVEGFIVKASGKTASFKEIVFVDDDFHLHSEVYKSVKSSSSGSSSCCNIKDSFKNLTTFRLGLDIRETEKIARDNLVLPYLRSSKGDDRTKRDEGKIVYFAELEDDLEDPDNDLDI